MHKTATGKTNWRLIIGIVAALVAVLFVYLQRDTIKKSLEALSTANWLYVALAIIVFSGTVFAAAAVIYNLRLVVKLSYLKTLVVQVATLFLGKITPASVGGLAAIGRFLFTQGHTTVQSGTVVAAGGVATFFGNVLITSIAVALSFRSLTFSSFKLPSFVIYIAIGVAVTVGILLLIAKIRNKVVSTLKEVVETLKKYEHNKWAVVRGILFGALVTLCFALTMMLAAKSLGVNISLLAAIVTVSFGSLGVAVTPLPGGMVGAEAALAATLTQFGVAPDVALAIAFVYRFVIFWLPLLPGFIASQYSLKKQLL